MVDFRNPDTSNIFLITIFQSILNLIKIILLLLPFKTTCMHVFLITPLFIDWLLVTIIETPSNTHQSQKGPSKDRTRKFSQINTKQTFISEC
jgi:hypothetical protein